jgi:hypothetical protein
MRPQTGQLDEISQAIGGLQSSVEGIERYMHEREHGLNNLAQKFDALGIRMAKDIAAVEGRIEGRIKAMDDRLIALEAARFRDDGARSVWKWIADHSPWATLVAALMAFIAWANGRLHL